MALDFLDEHDDATTSADETEAMRRGESAKSDVEAAEILTDKVSSLMISVATGGPEIKKVDADYKREHRALRAVLRRLDIEYSNKLEVAGSTPVRRFLCVRAKSSRDEGLRETIWKHLLLDLQGLRGKLPRSDRLSPVGQ